MKREPINFNNVYEGIGKLSEGNLEAEVILGKMLFADDDMSSILAIGYLSIMNIRGYQIWVAYKDYCGEDLDLLIKCIISNDEQMIRCVNIETAKCAVHGEVEEGYKAVKYDMLRSTEDDFPILTSEEIAELKDQPKPRHPSIAAGR